MASDQGLHCLLKEFSIKNRNKLQNRPDTTKMTNGLIHKCNDTIWVYIMSYNMETFKRIYILCVDRQQQVQCLGHSMGMRWVVSSIT